MRIGVFKISLVIVIIALFFSGRMTSKTLPPGSTRSIQAIDSLKATRDSLKASTRDSTALAVTDSLSIQDSLVIEDTLSISDSLAIKDSLSIADSLTIADSLAIPDSLAVADSLAVTDSTSLADSIKVYTEKELKRMRRDSVKAVRDSIKAVKDSIRLALPRILETSAFSDSLYFKRILSWNSDNKYNNLTPARIDTTMNDWYTEYPFFKEDVNATYLGVIGSPTQNQNFFTRKDVGIFPAYTPYMTYSFYPENMPFYNVKSTYTELAYWGTLFAYKDKEEANIRILHTQNITPALNLAFRYEKYGGKGLLENEETSNKTLSITGNYLGKKYVLNAGFIHNNIKRFENGGVQDTWWVRDTTVEAKTIAVNLTEARSKLSRNTAFVHHHYNFPIRFNKKKDKDTSAFTVAEPLEAPTTIDSTAIAARDTIPLDEGTIITIGHIGEVSRFYRVYTDEIALADSTGRKFYNHSFYIDPTSSTDSIRMLSIENKVFFKLQPWAKDAILSRVEGGIGYQFLNIFSFQKEMFLSGNTNKNQNNMYLYGGAGGKFRKYLDWSADIRYDFAGYFQNDLDIGAKVTVSFYPFKNKKEGVDVTGRFSSTLKRPDYFSNHYYSNHYVWDNDFAKVSTTKIEGEMDIKKWKFKLFFGYSLLNNNIYYDNLGIVRQNDEIINVISAYLKKDFKLWYFHLDNQILFQYSSKQDILPLPMLSAHLRYYFEYPLVKNAMTVQLGVDATYNTKYYVPSYNPALGQFQLQNREELGNCPYLDVFLNVQWKRASIFVKVLNVAQGWPTGDYFSAYGYIKPKRALKFGIHWPFYFK